MLKFGGSGPSATPPDCVTVLVMDSRWSAAVGCVSQPAKRVQIDVSHGRLEKAGKRIVSHFESISGARILVWRWTAAAADDGLRRFSGL
jgi:hypothetical protein